MSLPGLLGLAVGAFLALRGNGNKGNGPVAQVDERVHIHAGSHGGGGSRADAQLTPS